MLQSVDARDVWMIQCREQFGFSLETGRSIWIGGKCIRQDLEGDVALEPGVLRPVDLTHPARADGRDDFVGAETRTGNQGH